MIMLAKRFFTSVCLFSFQREHPAGKRQSSMLVGSQVVASLVEALRCISRDCREGIVVVAVEAFGV